MSNKTRRTTEQNLNRKCSKKQPRLHLSLLSMGEFGIQQFMDPKESLVALNMIDHVGPVRVRQLLEHFGDAPAILKASRHQLMHVSGIGEETADSIATWEKSVDLAAELKRIADFHAHVVVQSDPDYPEQLRHI